MIISRTPFRMSFVGGGSDLKEYYQHSYGSVVSTTINKFVYITANKKFTDYFRVSYSKTEYVKNVENIEHNLVREALKLLGITKGGIDIVYMSDMLPDHEGSGLGASSSLIVGTLNALHAFKGENVSAETLAREACKIEIEILGHPIGKQDQYAAAYGGLNFIQFNPDESVSIERIICKKDTILKLENNLLMLYTGTTRSASDILANQKKNMERRRDKVEIMKKMVTLSHTLKDELQKNNIETFGSILHENWLLKKEMADGISNKRVDYWYEKALKAGAIGGKLLGAGGGGFLLFYAPQSKHLSIKKALKQLRPMEFKFENQGSKIIFIH